MKCRHLRIVLTIVVCLIVALATSAASVQAANLSQASIRLSRAKANTSPGSVLILARPTTTATENQVAVQVASGYSISGSTGAYGVSTSSLPSGVSAWPGIGSPTNVTGNTITFPSGDLSSGTTYGFYITSGIGNNPSAGDGAHYLWNVATQNSGSVIDSSQQMVPIVSNDQITVSGIVPAQSTYFTTETQLLSSGSQFAQYQELEYKIRYGTTLAQSSDLTLQASWSLGTVEGAGSPSVEVLEYAIGSASQAYNSTPATIDLLNRTITWTIEDFPANTTTETVTFKLKTRRGYTGSQPVAFTVSSQVVAPVTTTKSSLTRSYLYNATLEPTPTPSPTVTGTTATPTPSPSTSPVPSASLTPTPTPTPTPLTEALFSSISFSELTTTQAGISVTTSVATPLQLRWGANSASLTGVLNSPAVTSQHQFSLQGLEAEQNYFFRLSSPDGSIISDIYTFKTAISNERPTIETIGISHRGITLIKTNDQETSSPTQELPEPLISIPIGAKNEFNFSIQQYQLIKELFVELRGPLSDSSLSTLLGYSATRLPVQAISPGQYVVSFISPSEPGIYEVVLQMTDINGNYQEKTITKLNSTRPITVLNKRTGKPIERARVEIGVYDEAKRLYNFLDRSVVFPEQQNLTDAEGVLDLALPLGKYQIEITAIGYNLAEVEFELDGIGQDEYPTVSLSPQPFNIMTIIHYYYDTGQHFWHMNLIHLQELGRSNDALQLTTLVIIFLLVGLSFIALLNKTHVSPRYLNHYLYAHWVVPLLKKSKKFSSNTFVLHGKVLSSDGKPLPQATIILLNPDTNAQIRQVSSNKQGLFHAVLSQPTVKYLITAQSHETLSGSTVTNPDGSPWLETFTLAVADKTIPKKLLDHSIDIVQKMFGLLFEMSLMLTVVLEVLFVGVFGLVQVAPAMLLTVLTVLIWVTYKSSDKFSN